MENVIKKVYDGLPEKLRSNVFWVADKYRTNELSHIPGGTEVVVEYHNGDVFGYDCIKFSSSYIFAIFRGVVENALENDDDDKGIDDVHVIDCSYGKSLESNIKIIKGTLSSIYIVKYLENTKEIIAYEKIWDSETSMDDPYGTVNEYFLKRHWE